MRHNDCRVSYENFFWGAEGNVDVCKGHIYRNSLFFRPVNFRRKIFVLKNFWTDQIERKYFTSRVWWALIEEIAQRAEEMACEKETACCVRGYHVYKDI